MKVILYYSQALMLLLVVTGCASSRYTTPGTAANLQCIDSLSIRDQFETKPAIQFPARIAVIRVQESGYRSWSEEGKGYGNYSIVKTRDVETQELVDKVKALPDVAGLVYLNTLLLPSNLNNIEDLRVGCASLHADVLLLYTFDTTFNIKGHDVGPLSVITLGFAPNKHAYITTTASAVFYDVRTGYVYGAAETSSKTDHLASIWSKEQVVENSRLETEKIAFSQLVDELMLLWEDIVAEYKNG